MSQPCGYEAVNPGCGLASQPFGVRPPERITAKLRRAIATCAAAAAFLLGVAASASAAELPAANVSELTTALRDAMPGDTVVLAPGVWSDVKLDITHGGKSGAPVTIRAREPGRTIFGGASSLTFSAPEVVVDGLLFTQGAISKGQVVWFHSDHCQLTNTAIVDYNPPKVATKYYWVYFEGDYNRLDHCFFKGKSNDQPLIGNAIKASRHNTTDHCYFKDIPFVPDLNGREDFRIWGYGGNEEMGDDGAFFTIEDNLFDHADGEGMEIISLKSNRNIVRRNTLHATRGGVTNRSGNFNTIEENLILCDGAAGAYGMRITGQYQRIVNNRIEHAEFGIHLMAGEFIASPLTPEYKPIERAGTPLGRVPAYNQPMHTLVMHNTLSDIRGVDLLFGLGYKSGWPHAQRVLLPEQNQILDNLIEKPHGGTAIDLPVQDKAAPLDRFAFKPNEFSGNVVIGGKVNLSPVPAGIALRETLTSATDTPGVNVKLHPLTPAEVGPPWVRARADAGEELFK